MQPPSNRTFSAMLTDRRQADTDQVRMMHRSWSSTCAADSRALGSSMSRLRINETVAGDTRLSLQQMSLTRACIHTLSAVFNVR